MTDAEGELRQARVYLEIYRTTAPLDPELRKRAIEHAHLVVARADKEPVLDCPGCGADCGFAFSLDGVPNELCSGQVEIYDYDEDGNTVHRCRYHRRWEDDRDMPLFPPDEDNDEG